MSRARFGNLPIGVVRGGTVYPSAQFQRFLEDVLAITGGTDADPASFVQAGDSSVYAGISSALATQLAELDTGLDAIETDIADLTEDVAELLAGMNTVLEDGSSTVQLAAGASFTGAWVDVSAYDSLTVAAATDQDGTFNIQFSPDASAVDSSLTRYYRTGQIELPHRFTVTRKYARVVFTNTSATDQTYFRLQTLAGDKGLLNAPTDGTLPQDFDATVVRPTDYAREVALGRRQGAETVITFGRNSDVDVAAEEVIAAFGGTFTPLASASTLTIVSSSTDDDGAPAGIGAQTLLISGLDANRAAQSETVTMNGTTNVVTSAQWLAVNHVAVSAAGSSQGNVGDIAITATTGGSNQAYIPAGDSVTQQCIFSTPAGHNALITSIAINALHLSGGSSPRVTVRLRVWNPGGSNAVRTVYRLLLDTSVQNSEIYTPLEPILLNPTDVAWLVCTTDHNNTAIDARFAMQVIRQPST